MNTKSKKSHPKFGVIDTGGGLRGIYGAGVLDYCMDNDLHFDLCCGVSAGAANLISYQAGQSRRNLMFYLDYAFRKEYMSMDNFLKERLLSESRLYLRNTYERGRRKPSGFFRRVQKSLRPDHRIDKRRNRKSPVFRQKRNGDQPLRYPESHLRDSRRVPAPGH